MQPSPNRLQLRSLGGLELPKSYDFLVHTGRGHVFWAWSLVTRQEEADALSGQFAKEAAPYPDCPVKEIAVFARAAGSDDVAGFVVERGRVTSQVASAHLRWHDAYPAFEIYSNIWEWVQKHVVPEAQAQYGDGDA